MITILRLILGWTILSILSQLVSTIPPPPSPPSTSNEDEETSKGYIMLTGQKTARSLYSNSNSDGRPVLKEKRSADGDGTANYVLENESAFYTVKIQIGSERDEVEVLVDTGSAGLWVTNSNNSYCIPGSNLVDHTIHHTEKLKKNDKEEIQKIETKSTNNASTTMTTEQLALSKRFILYGPTSTDWDFQTTGDPFSWYTVDASPTDKAVVSAGRAVTSKKVLYNCSQYGVFNPHGSTSYENKKTEFEVQYGDGTHAKGWNGQDAVYIQGTKLNKAYFAVADHTDSSVGVMGIGIVPDCSDGCSNANLPMQMKSQGIIKKSAYSIYLNGSNSHTANILFGGVDHDRYIDQLTLFPLVNINSKAHSSPSKIDITLSSISIGKIDKGLNARITKKGGSAPVLLDTGNTLAKFPDNILRKLVSELNLRYSRKMEHFLMKCDEGNNYYITFSFQGSDISVPVSSFLVRIEMDHGKFSEYCALGITPNFEDAQFSLGDSFLRSVYLVVDLEDKVVAMAPANFDSKKENIEVITKSVPSAKKAKHYKRTWKKNKSLRTVKKPKYSKATSTSMPVNSMTSIAGPLNS